MLTKKNDLYLTSLNDTLKAVVDHYQAYSSPVSTKVNTIGLIAQSLEEISPSLADKYLDAIAQSISARLKSDDKDFAATFQDIIGVAAEIEAKLKKQQALAQAEIMGSV